MPTTIDQTITATALGPTDAITLPAGWHWCFFTCDNWGAAVPQVGLDGNFIDLMSPHDQNRRIDRNTYHQIPGACEFRLNVIEFVSDIQVDVTKFSTWTNA